jgi:hypothetical protein
MQVHKSDSKFFHLLSVTLTYNCRQTSGTNKIVVYYLGSPLIITVYIKVQSHYVLYRHNGIACYFTITRTNVSITAAQQALFP